jgi:hypothetical protein
MSTRPPLFLRADQLYPASSSWQKEALKCQLSDQRRVSLIKHTLDSRTYQSVLSYAVTMPVVLLLLLSPETSQR